jgi:hypothetical protein
MPRFRHSTGLLPSALRHRAPHLPDATLKFPEGSINCLPCGPWGGWQSACFFVCGVRSLMLRITQAETATEQRWTLCGRLTGPSVAVLRACWEHDRHAAGGVRRVLDLSDVTLIDESGERLLAEMRRGGTEFVAAGVATKHLVDSLGATGSSSVTNRGETNEKSV